MKVICPHVVTGLCPLEHYISCPHGTLHEPILIHGGGCHVRSGTCQKTMYRVTCIAICDPAIPAMREYLDKLRLLPSVEATGRKEWEGE